MKRLERLGSLAFLTVTISFVFHLIGMSFNHWIENHSINSNQTDPLVNWHTSLINRCYKSSMASIFISSNQLINLTKYQNSFLTEICIPNQYLTYKKPIYENDCLRLSIQYPHTVCALGIYDQNICTCDKSNRTKIVLSMTILTSIFLGIMLFLSHIISLIKSDRLLKWIIPICLIILLISILFIIVTLAVLASRLKEDVNQTLFTSSQISQAFQNDSSWEDLIESRRNLKYQVRVGWCYGMEILSLNFTIVSAVIYGLMLVAKNRPE